MYICNRNGGGRGGAGGNNGSEIAESEGIREEDEYELDDSASSSNSSGACTIEEAIGGNEGCSSHPDNVC